MPGSDFTALNAAIASLTTQVTATQTTEASASALIAGFAKEVTDAVTAALAADDVADQGSITAATSAIAGVTAQFQASAASLGDAVVAGTPVAPTQAPAPTS